VGSVIADFCSTRVRGRERVSPRVPDVDHDQVSGRRPSAGLPDGAHYMFEITRDEAELAPFSFTSEAH
jgi:hypothetical protein